MLVYSYPKIAFRLFILIALLTGLLVWLFARGGTYHIGASGVVYGIAAFLFFSGFFRKDKLSMVIALIVALFYGSMVWGVLPLQKGVSWESHLLGGIVGVVLAYLFKDYNKLTPQVSWKEEDLEDRSFKHFMEEKGG
jgi:membrane associated rhomboid family serine protease